MSQRKVIIIDLMPLIFRAYFATLGKNISTSEGIPTGGILGFYNYIFQLLFEEKPDIIIATQDSAPEERLAIDPAYKANREESPEELGVAIDYAYRLLYCLNIPLFTIAGQEADDIIGSLCKTSEMSDQIYIVSPDKDLAQLVNDHVFLLRPAYKGNEFNVLDIEGVKEKFGVPPEKIPDLLSLMGDSVDNIKGVPGVGEKTAAKLLSENVNIESLYETGIQKLKEGKLKENLLAGKDETFRSKKLATIRCDLEVSIDFAGFNKDDIRHELLSSLLDELEFRKLKERLETKGFLSPASVTEPVPVHYAESLAELGNDMISVEPIQNSELLILAAKGKVLYISPEQFKIVINQFDLIVCSDLKALHKCVGINYSNIFKVYDVSIAEYLLNPDKTIDHDHLARKYKIPYPVPDRKAQHEQIAIALEAIYSSQISRIEELNLHNLLYDIEMPLSLVLGEMEIEGVYIDADVLENAGQQIEKEIRTIEKSIYSLTGKEFNINSTTQIGDVLKELLGPGLRKTKTGKISSGEKILDELRDEHPVIPLLQQYRKLTKLFGTYISALPKYISPETGRIHATFSQVTAGTGRLSCHSPNLQNLPIRHEEGQIIRKAVKADNKEFELVSADYSQVELRLLASLSDDPNMIRAFQEDQDIHAITASQILKLPLSSITDKERGLAKGVNFGIVYGITPFGLAERLKISQTEAKEFITGYFKAFPRVKDFQESTLEFARQNGYTQTQTGRIRYIDGINSRNGTTRKNAERVALNAPIQGLAADLIKIAMIRCSKFIKDKSLQSRMILQIHDELLFEAHKDERADFSNEIKGIMESALDLSVPLKVEVGYGPDWMNLIYE